MNNHSYILTPLYLIFSICQEVGYYNSNLHKFRATQLVYDAIP